MKARWLLWIALGMQVIFLLFVALIAPEGRGFITIGLERLKEVCASASPTPAGTREGTRTLSTAGDFFFAGRDMYSLITHLTLIVMMLNVVLLALFFLRNRRKSNVLPAAEG